MEWIIGCYTPENNAGLVRVEYDGSALRVKEECFALANPTYACWNADGTRLYTASEMADAPKKEKIVVMDMTRPGFEILSECGLSGNCPCYIAQDASGKYLFGANYDAGSVSVFTLDGDNVSPLQIIPHKPGPGQTPHAHMCVPSPDSGCMYAVDLGLDTIITYRLNTDDGLYYRIKTTLTLPSGCGPRHMVLSGGGKYAYLASELSSCVFVLRRENDAFLPLQCLSALPVGYPKGKSFCAAIKMASGCIWVSNRGHDSIAVFRIGEDHMLTMIDIVQTGVCFPRDFDVLADGSILVAGQKSNDLKMLKKTPEGYVCAAELHLTAPVCVLPVR